MSTGQDNERTFQMEPEAWLDINAVSTEAYGMPFAELAEANSAAAYAFFREAMLHLVQQAAIGQFETPHGPTYQATEALLPEEVTEPLDIVINIFDTMGEDGTELPREFGRAAETIVSFSVEPPTDLISDWT